MSPSFQATNKSSFNVLMPPAKIANPAFGSDVAARNNPALLRAAVVHVPEVASKMSTTLDTPSASEKKHET